MDILTEFKLNLHYTLQKQGSSLEELERALAKDDLAFVTEKIAGFGDVVAQGGKALITGAPELAFALSAILGTIGGGGLYAIDNHLHNQDSRLKTKQDEADRVKQVGGRLKSDFNLQENE